MRLYSEFYTQRRRGAKAQRKRRRKVLLFTRLSLNKKRILKDNDNLAYNNPFPFSSPLRPLRLCVRNFIRR